MLELNFTVRTPLLMATRIFRLWKRH